MKIYKPIGSKDRLFEMMQNVNKIQINEDILESSDIIRNSFDELKSGKLNVQKTNTLMGGNDTFVEIIGVDNVGNVVTFRFKVTATEGDQDGVYDIDTATLSAFTFKGKTDTFEADENADAVKRFNAENSQEIIDVVSNYVDFESETPEIDEAFLEAAKKIDSYPFGGTPRPMQTPKAYANEKPTNPAVRVKAPELDDEDKYVLGEMQTGKAYADEKPTNPAVRVKAPELDKYVDEESVPDNKIKIITTAINNLTEKGKSRDSLTTSEVNAEIKRMLSSGEANIEESLVNTIAQKYIEKRPLGEKLRAIQIGKIEVDQKLAESGIDIEDIPFEKYHKLVKIAANRLLTRNLASMNEGWKENLLGGAAMTIATMGGMNQAQAASKFGDKFKQNIEKVGGGIQKAVGGIKDKVADFKMHQDAPQEGETFKHAFARMGKMDGFGWGNSKDYNIARKKALYSALVELNHDSGKQASLRASLDPKSVETVEEKVFQEDGEYVVLMVLQLAGTSQGQSTPQTPLINKQPVLDKAPEYYKESALDEDDDDGMSFEPHGDEVEQLAQDREMEVGSDEESPLEYDPDQILAGLRVEMEENPDPMEALEIVMANLEEDPEFYDVSEEEPEEDEVEDDEEEPEEDEVEPEEDDEENFEVDKIDNVDNDGVEVDDIEVDNVDNPDDKEMTDVLLGYKSKNVGDDVDESGATWNRI